MSSLQSAGMLSASQNWSKNNAVAFINVFECFEMLFLEFISIFFIFL